MLLIIKKTGGRAVKKIQENPVKILWLIIIIYILLFSCFSLYKYISYNYIGLDLSIYNQVFFNSSQGHLFGLTIHPHSYLGDHFELIIAFLLPFYFILKTPITLLILQTIILGLSAYPLFLIARLRLSKNISLFVSIVYLTNVFIHNINTYEFHILPVAIPLLFLMFYFYQKNRFGLFMLFLGLSLLVREDVSLVIFAFGFFALTEKKSLKWIIPPIVIGLLWFILSLKMTAFFSGYSQYKFIRYYGWLGQDLKSIVLAIINHPGLVFRHFFSGANISFLVGLFLPFGFLPLLKPKYLLPASIIILQIILLSSAGALALEIHYTSLIIPFLFIALIYSMEKILYHSNKNKVLVYLQNEKIIFITILLLISIYSSLYIGPAYYLITDLFKYPAAREEISLRNDLIKNIEPNASVATGFNFIPKLSSRENVYSLHYQYLGKKQYSDEDYRIPENVDYLLFDLNDFVYYHYLYREYDEKNIEGAKRIRELIAKDFGLTNYIGKFILFQKNMSDAVERPYSIINKLPAEAEQMNLKLKDNIALIGQERKNISEISINNNSYRVLPVSLYWQSLEKTKNDYQMKAVFLKNNKIAYEQDYPLSGFYPTHDWQPGEIIKVNHQFLMPTYLKKGEYQVILSFYETEGKMGLSKDKIFRPFIQNSELLGQNKALWITL
ncbi:MAG: DUF2079 domain-containing protein [Patescibacteria group bacterium]